MSEELAEPKKQQTPFFKKILQPILVPLLAVLTAILLGGLVIFIAGGNPILAYTGLLEGAFGSSKALAETTVWATPYIFAGLAVALAFKGGLFNIGAEGQLALGAVAAAWVGYALPGMLNIKLPMILHLPLTVLAGAAIGFIWGGIPGWLKAKYGGHEVINTIMMNYIALNLTSFLLNGPMRDKNPQNMIARTPLIEPSAQFPPIFPNFRLHWGFILALLVAYFVYWLLWRTTLGYEIRTVGLNASAAKYAGISVEKITFLSMAFSGALAGLAGSIEVTALNYRHELGFSSGYGFDAIAIALLGKTHPAGVVLAAILFGAMRNGASRMQFVSQIPVDIISVIQGLILLFVAADVIIKKIYRIKQKSSTEAIMTRGWGG